MSVNWKWILLPHVINNKQVMSWINRQNSCINDCAPNSEGTPRHMKKCFMMDSTFCDENADMATI